MRYRFEEFEFDSVAMELRSDGVRVEVQPSVLDLLELLILNADRVVTKDEIIDRLWGGRLISDDAITKRVSQLRKALDESNRDRRLIRSIYGKGMRFMGKVDREVAGTSPGVPAARASAFTSPAAPGEAEPPLQEIVWDSDQRRSIAILPFKHVGVAGPHAMLAQAFPDEIIMALSRLRFLFVIARGSTFRFPSYAHSLARIRQELKVQYCLSGTVAVHGARVAIIVELADTVTGELVWSERYEIAPDEVHVLRREIVGKVITAVELEISAHEAELARLKHTHSLSAWENYHLGLSKIFTIGRQDFDGALANFSRALELDPAMARAAAALGYVGWYRSLRLPVEERQAEVEMMLRAVETGMEIDPNDPFVLAMFSRGQALNGEIDTAISSARRAVQISPSYSIGFAALAGAQSLSGSYQPSLGNNQMAIDLSPLDPNFHYMCGVQIIALIGLGRIEEAADWARKALDFRRDAPPVLGSCILAFHLAGRTQEAAQAVAALREFDQAIDAENLLSRIPQLTEEIRQLVRQVFASYGLT